MSKTGLPQLWGKAAPVQRTENAGRYQDARIAEHHRQLRPIILKEDAAQHTGEEYRTHIGKNHRSRGRSFYGY
ncbi:MAG: hypothetical protein QF437_20680 [Planctomycetota bacterium]|nr:hypothetical protein [Planctomycetota bacterium]MDP7132923.1 hypothetical protein [Planctomycetota bacterium]MDP7251789.1 hypothetical protein [Planctomycetota bacterium]